jgi:hypothetical protein
VILRGLEAIGRNPRPVEAALGGFVFGAVEEVYVFHAAATSGGIEGRAAFGGTGAYCELPGSMPSARFPSSAVSTPERIPLS